MDKLSYALGVSVGHNLVQSGVTELNADDFAQAVKIMLENGKPAISYEEVNAVLSEFFGQKEKAEEVKKASAKEKNMQEGLDFLNENKQRENVVTLASGLQYEIMKAGEGKKPGAKDKVQCHYHGTLIDGTVFDSSVLRNEPAVFGVNQVIQGWVEALQLMPVGSKWKLFIPSNLAYGTAGAGASIGPNATLIFEVELLAIV
ncbi:MAG: FKBP-type peptidyl-prolyl cis-trans isomerase [Bacteroidales bacterium]|jgi:FKBP-type peptidyl-prolyl cis-trans isomerase FklB|nr:FKBP-type peptidyl-prolyl cis-trans isomerase [Bacteroidales bacterium]MDD3162340.1 FKBP-type peptidyl-prolyl cis-trans isomerase [Bacteroidales bacterium]